MKALLSMALVLTGCASVAACAEKAHAPVAEPALTSAADNWEPGKDLAGTQVVIGGVSQEVPADLAASKRKLDAVEADYRAQMDELEKKRLKNFAPDSDIRP